MEKNINIFISSAFRNMHFYRDQLMYEVRPIVNQMCQKRDLDVHLNFIDLRWGVDEGNKENSLGKYFQILETCFRVLDKTDIFIGMYTDYRGTFITHEEIDLLNEQYHWNLPYDSSLTELELWYCKNVKDTPTKYCKIYFHDDDSLNNKITETENSITVKGSTKEKFNEILARKIYIEIQECLNSTLLPKVNDFERTMIPRSDIINEIIFELFFNVSSNHSQKESINLTVLKGESGIGKSVLLSQLYDAIIEQDLLTPVYLEDASHVSALDDLINSSFSVYNIELPKKHMTLAEKIRYLRKSISYFRIPCFIIDSIDDISPEYFNQFLIELENNFIGCYIITSTTKKVEERIQQHTYRLFEIETFHRDELETAINLYEKNLLKRFPDSIRQKLLEFENTVYAKPIIFQLILNDLSLLSARDYMNILNSSHYSIEIEKIMMNRLQNYSSDIQGIISEICSRITGSFGDSEGNVLIQRYLALIILSYKGVNEEYLSNVMGEQWKPLLFYQLRYSFRNIFMEQYNSIVFSHQIFKSVFYNIIPSKIIDDMINKIISKREELDDGMRFEKYRMCFFGERFDIWYHFAQDEEGWEYLADCLNEYCQLEHPLGKKYLSVPIHWIEYMARLSRDNILNTQDYVTMLGMLYYFINELTDTTTTRAFDTVLICCEKYINSVGSFIKNCGDDNIIKECVNVIKHFYQRVIECAEEFSIHEKVKPFVDSYQKIIDAYNNLLESENREYHDHKEKVKQKMWQLFDIARFKLNIDIEREEARDIFLKILELSQKEKIIFPNFGQIVNALLTMLEDITPVIEYIDFGIWYVDEFMTMNKKYSEDEVTFLIDVYHCKLMIEGRLGRIKENEDELRKYVIREYNCARFLYEENPQKVRFVYTYSMACSDLTIMYTFLEEYEKIKVLNETNKKLKGYLHTQYPDTFLYAESYSIFLYNCANYSTIYSDDERICFIEEAFETLSPYLKLNNIKASWEYLNLWKAIVDGFRKQKDADKYKIRVQKGIEKQLQYLPHVLKVIFEGDEHNITFRKEALSRVADIYNLYRFVADKKVLCILGKSIYDIAVQICNIENSDYSYLFLASTIKTLCADQISDFQNEVMDDVQLLKGYQKYIESKIKMEPQRIVFHQAMLAVPEAEMTQMMGMLAGIEKMPEMAKFLLKMTWEKMDIHPTKIILDAAYKMIDRMEIINSLGGEIPQDTKEVTEMILRQLLQTEKDYTCEIVGIIQILKKY